MHMWLHSLRHIHMSYRMYKLEKGDPPPPRQVGLKCNLHALLMVEGFDTEPECSSRWPVCEFVFLSYFLTPLVTI